MEWCIRREESAVSDRLVLPVQRAIIEASPQRALMMLTSAAARSSAPWSGAKRKDCPSAISPPAASAAGTPSPTALQQNAITLAASAPERMHQAPHAGSATGRFCDR